MVAWTGGVLEFRPRRGVSKHQLVHVMREKRVCDVYNCSDLMAYYLEYMVVENKERCQIAGLGNRRKRALVTFFRRVYH